MTFSSLQNYIISLYFIFQDEGIDSDIQDDAPEEDEEDEENPDGNIFKNKLHSLLNLFSILSFDLFFGSNKIIKLIHQNL